MRSVPTTDSATWWPTPAAASAASRFAVERSKNATTADSSNDGEFDTSTTTSAPTSTSGRPSPVSVFTPVWGAAATASCPFSLRFVMTCEPMRPVPPMTTIFMGKPFSRCGTSTVRTRQCGHFVTTRRLSQIRPPTRSWLMTPQRERTSSMAATPTSAPVVLEPASQAFVEATAVPPFLYELTPDEARKVLDDVQAAPIDKLPVDERWITAPAEAGDVQVRIIRPAGAEGTLPVILYMHGGGWVLGNAATHDRLVRELACGTGAALAFVEYDRSPEAHYPVAIEQGYATARWIVREGAAHGLDPQRMAVAGDSVGGGMAAVLTLMAEGRGDVRFVHQSMYYPVTDAAMDTASYAQFAEGYFLTAKAMAWFWDAYAPDPETRGSAYASPLRAAD